MSADEAGPGDELPNVREGLLTVPEAAKALGISVSTAWRWIDRGILPSVRIGPKRVFVRREELAPTTGAGRAIRITRPRKMTKAEQRRGLAWLERLREELASQLAARGGAYFPPSEDVIDQMREERSRHLVESGGGRFKSFDRR
jgi:excisionase family DNA binding protein